MAVYLNIVEFGDGIYGAEAAAQHFFGKPASKLSAREAALLASSLRNPFIFRGQPQQRSTAAPVLDHGPNAHVGR